MAGSWQGHFSTRIFPSLQMSHHSTRIRSYSRKGKATSFREWNLMMQKSQWTVVGWKISQRKRQIIVWNICQNWYHTVIKLWFHNSIKSLKIEYFSGFAPLFLERPILFMSPMERKEKLWKMIWNICNSGYILYNMQKRFFWRLLRREKLFCAVMCCLLQFFYHYKAIYKLVVYCNNHWKNSSNFLPGFTSNAAPCMREKKAWELQYFTKICNATTCF